MPANNLNVCIFPMKITWENVAENLIFLESALLELHPLTDLVVLPETFSTGFPSTVDPEIINKIINEVDVVSKLKVWAKKYNVAFAGSFIANSEGKLYNRGFFIEPTGDVYYADKKHLFSLGGEDALFSRGDKRLSVRYRGWNISMIICYDLRFPVWCRNVNNSYDLLLVVANWPKVRIDAWNKLLAARAIENEAYVIGCNCSGFDKKNIEYDGTSHIINFKGLEISHNSSPFLYASLSYEKLIAFRDKFPVWKDADKFYFS